MAKYRKRPLVVEAVQLTDADFDAPHPFAGHIKGVIYCPITRTAEIYTLEGVMRASVGSWIIRGVNGELYPIKDAIFRETYEAI